MSGVVCSRSCDGWLAALAGVVADAGVLKVVWVVCWRCLLGWGLMRSRWVAVADSASLAMQACQACCCGCWLGYTV